MMEFFVQNAFAQGFGSAVKSTAATGRDVAVDGAQSGIGSLFSYVGTNIDNWIAGIVIIVIFWILGRMAASAIKEAIIKEKEEVQESALILVTRITKIAVNTIGVTIAFAINGLNFTAVIGALSLGIGFALKDIIGNFISGVIMLSQDRIKIGDFIKVDDILGTIVSIDTRATILQGIDGTEVVIPNITMLGETVISYSTNPFRRIELIVGVDYSTDLPMVTSLVKGIIDRDKGVVPKPESMVLVDEFGDSAITIKIRFWVESSSDWVAIRSNLANKIKKAFDEVGINIPFPITTLKIDADDRAFLQTMDSMKKGVVPAEAEKVSDDKIVLAASQTAFEKEIPYNIFGENQEVPHPVKEQSNEPTAEQAIEPTIEDKPLNDTSTQGNATNDNTEEKTAPDNARVEKPPSELTKEAEQPVAAVAAPMTPPPTHL